VRNDRRWVRLFFGVREEGCFGSDVAPSARYGLDALVSHRYRGAWVASQALLDFESKERTQRDSGVVVRDVCTSGYFTKSDSLFHGKLSFYLLG
jgi:hypothetical protein